MKYFAELEKSVFRLSMLLLLAPKTLIKIILYPKWPVVYLSEERMKPSENRYDAYTSPILFWSIFSIATIMLHTLLSEALGIIMDDLGGVIAGAVSGAEISHEPTPVLPNLDFSQHRFMQALIISVWFPLSFSTLLVMFLTKNLAKSTTEWAFYVQCYAFGAFVAIYTIAEFLLAFLDVGSIAGINGTVNIYALTISLLWYINFQNIHFRTEGIKKPHARLLLILIALSASILLCYTTTFILIDMPSNIFKFIQEGG